MESFQRKVAWYNEASNVGEKLANASDIEEGHEKVSGNETDNGVRPWELGVGFELVKDLDIGETLVSW